MSATNEFTRVKYFVINMILSDIDSYYHGDIEYYVNEKWLDKEIAKLLKASKTFDAIWGVKQHKELKRLYDYPQQLYFEIKQYFRQRYESINDMKGHRTCTPSKKPVVKLNVRGMF